MLPAYTLRVIALKLYACLKRSRSCFITIFCVAAATALFVFGESAKRGVTNGLIMCANILIPSLFPFMALSCFFCESGASAWVSKKISFLFLLPLGKFRAFCDVFILSAIGGYPASATALKTLYENGEIDQDAAKVLLLFAVNPSPAFVVTAVGRGMLHSAAAGWIIYLSCILSSLLIGAFVCRISKASKARGNMVCSVNSGLTGAFVNGTASASNAMLCICSTVVLFSWILEMLSQFSHIDFIGRVLCRTMEVTSACCALAGKVSLPELTAVVAFGGFCTGMQILVIAGELAPRSLLFWCSRVVHALIAGVLAEVFLCFFPLSMLTISNNAGPALAGYSVSPFASAAVIFTAIILICSLERSRSNEKQEICES